MEEHIIMQLQHYTGNHVTSASGWLELHAENEVPNIVERVERSKTKYLTGLQRILDGDPLIPKESDFAQVKELRNYAAEISWTEHKELMELYALYEGIVNSE
jgi:hypothetical protein